MDAWNTIVSFWGFGLFSGAFAVRAVSFRECNTIWWLNYPFWKIWSGNLRYPPQSYPPPLVSLNKALLGPYFLGRGGLGGGTLGCHEIRLQLSSAPCWVDDVPNRCHRDHNRRKLCLMMLNAFWVQHVFNNNICSVTKAQLAVPNWAVSTQLQDIQPPILRGG